MAKRKKKQTKTYRSQEEWEGHFKAQENGEFTVAEYCRRHGIDVSTFRRKWMKMRQGPDQEPDRRDQQNLEGFHERNRDAGGSSYFITDTKDSRGTDWEQYIAPLRWLSLDDVKVKLPNEVEISVPCNKPDILKMVMEFAAAQTRGKGK